MQFKEETNYTFDDIWLKQRYSNIGSRTEVDITPQSPLSTTIPLISSNMNSVTGKRMAEKLARFGGLGVLPQDMPLDKMLEVINYVHSADLRLDTPLTVRKDDNIRTVNGIIGKRSHQSVVMVDDKNKPIGVISHSDLQGYDEHEKLSNINVRRAIVGKEGITDEQAFNMMDENHISSLPVVRNNGELIGVLTKSDSIRNSIYQPATTNGHLDVSVALSVNGYEEKIDSIVKAGVNTIFVDTAHGYTESMKRALGEIREKYSDIILVAGNVMDGKGAEFLLESGANGVKIGIGPGGMCTTRMMTGTGRPQFSAVLDGSEAANSMGGFTIADGGIKYPRDLAFSMAAGASHIMLGTILAGTYESPPNIEEDEEGAFKRSWGMASGKAVKGRTKQLSKFEQTKRERFQEGVSNAKIRGIKPLGDVVDNFSTGLVSAMTYSGAKKLKEFNEKAIVGTQKSSGFKEGTPHGK